MEMTKLSIITMLLAGLTTVSMAEVTTELSGQGVIYYQTDDGGDNNLFDQESSSANVGLELQLKADIGHGFDVAYQETFLGTLGLEKNLVSGVRQYAQKNDLNAHAMSKLYVSKKINNTLVKLGRQELPKSLSPLAFSESWNVFKNTFDAAVVLNKDIIDTTLVGAYVSASNTHSNMGGFNDLAGGRGSQLDKSANRLNSGAYMLTVANKSLKKMPITATYYALKDINNGDSGEALWLDVKAKHLPVKLAFQAGQIDPSNSLDKTTAYGLKASGKIQKIGVSLAYSSVNDGAVSLQNVGTGVKTPLYTQMLENENFISSDADTIVFKVGTKLPVGKLVAVYDNTKDNSIAKNNYQELDIVYKFKALGTNMLLAYIGQKTDKATFSGEKNANNLRFWTRYNF